MPKFVDTKEVANRVFHFYMGQHTTLQAWAFYLFDPQFEHEQELRNRAATIWLCSLYDALDGETRLLPDLLLATRKTGRTKLIHYCEKIEEMCVAIRAMLSRYTQAEQLFLYDFRCQMVHTWGSNVFQPQVAVKYVEQQKLVRKKIAREDYRAIIRPLFEAGPLDETLANLLAPILSKSDPFLVGILNALFVPGNLDLLRRDIFDAVE